MEKKKFVVYTTFTQAGKYVVEAETKEEAETLWLDGTWESYEEDVEAIIDSQEEISEIEEII